MEDGLFGALAGLRVLLLLNAIGVSAWEFSRGGPRGDVVAHPLGVVAALAVMTGWTAAATYLYASPTRRGPLVLGLDLGLALALLVASPLIKGPGLDSTIPGFWVMAPLLAWAVHLGWAGGLAAGVLLAVFDLALRDTWSQSVYGNAFLLVIGGPVVGVLSGSLQRLAGERDQAERAAAVAAERARLARAVHDGVLQVLALVQRRAGELGPDGADLARLAGEQEATLRTLIRTQDSTLAPSLARSGAGPTVDLTEALVRLGARPGVEVAAPASRVAVSPLVASELVAVAAACLDNVARHVGDYEPAWVLLEDLGDQVGLSVRDAGPGIAEGRLEAAASQGRLGVSEAIRGRVRDLGGSASLETGPHGTQWTFVVPREGS